MLLILNLSGVPRLDGVQEDAALMRFFVVERSDIKFTDKAEDTDIAKKIFPLSITLRTFLQEGQAAAFYLKSYLQPFLERHTFEPVLEYVHHPLGKVATATARFLREAEDLPLETPTPQSTTRADSTSDHLARKLHALVRDAGGRHCRWPPYLTKWDVTNLASLSALPFSKRQYAPGSRKRRGGLPSRWESAQTASQRAPELLYVDGARDRQYYLLVDPELYDKHLSGLELPNWRYKFRLADAVATYAELVDDSYLDGGNSGDSDKSDRQRCGTYAEIVNLLASYLELRCRYYPSEAKALAKRLQTITKHTERVCGSGEHSAGPFWSIRVQSRSRRSRRRAPWVGRRNRLGPRAGSVCGSARAMGHAHAGVGEASVTNLYPKETMFREAILAFELAAFGEDAIDG